jgi:hypothetical protein
MHNFWLDRKREKENRKAERVIRRGWFSDDLSSVTFSNSDALVPTNCICVQIDDSTWHVTYSVDVLSKRYGLPPSVLGGEGEG